MTESKPARTVHEAERRGEEYLAAWKAGYNVGFDEGEDDLQADLTTILEECEAPEDVVKRVRRISGA